MEKPEFRLPALLAEAITTFNTANEAHADLYRQAHAAYVRMTHDDRYTAEYCRRELNAATDSADTQLAEMVEKINGELRKHIAGSRLYFETKLSETSNDAGYAGHKTFALQAIQALGATITDDEAANVTSEFRRNLPTMRLFHTIIERQIDDPKRLAVFTDPDFARVASADRPALVEAVGNGLTGFKETFDYLVRADRVLELLSTLEETAEKAFLNKPTSSNEELPLGGGHTDVLSLPMISLTELMRVEQMKKLAQQVETVLNFMAVCGDFQ